MDSSLDEAWLEVEILACEAWSELGHIPKADVQKIRQRKVNVERAQEIEQETRHDVVAFTRQVSETLGEEERKWVHYGLNSTDVVDTALSFVINKQMTLLKRFRKIYRRFS